MESSRGIFNDIQKYILLCIYLAKLTNYDHVQDNSSDSKLVNYTILVHLKSYSDASTKTYKCLHFLTGKLLFKVERHPGRVARVA